MARPKLNQEQLAAAQKSLDALKKQGIRRQLPAMSSRARQEKQRREREAIEYKNKALLREYNE